MTVETVDRILGRVTEIRDNLLHLGEDQGILGVDGSSCIMAGRADIAMGLQNIGPV